MTPEDAAKILLLVQVFDNRQFDETTARVWADALDGLELGDCLDAVRIYYRQTRDWLMPSDLRDQARSVIRGRKERERKETNRLALVAGLPDEDRITDHVETIRKIVADTAKMPPPKSPHPPMEPPMLKAAKKVKCPWCGAARKSPCRNRWTEQTVNFAHELRLMEAGLIPKDPKAYAVSQEAS